MDRQNMRISDAERQEVADRLRDALGEGRLELSEFDERVQSAYQAKTYRELTPLTADLPSAPMPLSIARRNGGPVTAAEASRRAAALLSMVFVFIALGVLVSVASGGTVLPFWPLFIFAFWGLSRRAGHYNGR